MNNSNDREKRIVYDEAKAQEFYKKLMPKLIAWDGSSDQQKQEDYENRIGRKMDSKTGATGNK